MKKLALFPRGFRLIGLVLFALSVVLFIAWDNNAFQPAWLNTAAVSSGSSIGDVFVNNNLTDELLLTSIIVSLCMIAFSRQRHEDEYIMQVRLRSLLTSVYVSYAVFIIITFTVYGLEYLGMLFYNVFTILVLFIIIFNFNLYILPRMKQGGAHEE